MKRSRFELYNDNRDNNAEEQLDCFFETANSKFQSTQDKFSEILFENEEQFDQVKNKILDSQLDSLSLDNTSLTSNSNQLMQSNDNSSIIKRTNVQNYLSSFNPNSDFLINNYQTMPTKSTKVKECDRHLHTVIQLQNFQGDGGEIWVTKFSHDGAYIATAGKTGVLKIWEMVNEEESIFNLRKKGIIEYLKFVKETPYRIFKEHKNEIIDLDWSEMNKNLLVSVSVDHLAILWDITKESCISIYNHNGILSCISFCPFDSLTMSSNKREEIFATGCFDKIIRIWGMNSAAPLAYVNVSELITAISFFPQGNMIAVGNSNSKVSIYEFNVSSLLIILK